jgi:hypothetical protein
MTHARPSRSAGALPFSSLENYCPRVLSFLTVRSWKREQITKRVTNHLAGTYPERLFAFFWQPIGGRREAAAWITTSSRSRY